ncbi:NmrA/HSCARG family protein [Aureimonas jatrophae]|uniref:Uncharacterized conserved protein YbjT, contains NAD(P)-binding and DUF2867 domains n=1 Tax=Aureimonas jatrophae TaxID=1166073 RepID=A0A1H0KSA7_9HYPH|nr:NmrA/HSCARG family protein [Aureimonas jatrophae]MBB3948846.1 uncharacterized protein YbjT (DUF2867 family) [Aureimonas jatrophae]SDO58673.1 Uncharacterized conserved protein YbjT, contains NAD(P)-binding and DUF2867 domains [Aureimonas jatrophae]
MTHSIKSATAETAVRGENRTVLVFGATGQQGGAVASELLSRGWSVRALVRDPSAETAKRLGDLGTTVVAGDLADAASVRSAMRGAYGVFSVQPSSGQGAAYGVTDEQEVRYGKTVADLALAEGVRHLVYTSIAVSGAGPTGMGHFDSKMDIENHVRGLDLCSTIVRPTTFMELLLLPGMGLDQGAYTFFLRPDQTGQIIAVRDIGRIVAAVFADAERFAGRTIEIAGDEVTGRTLGEALARAAGRPIAYQRFPDALLADNAFLGRIASLMDEGRLGANADISGLEREFGALTRFPEWLAGPGQPLLRAAMETERATIALR